MTENSLPRFPKNWTWARIGQLYEIVGGGTPATCILEYWNGDIPWITSADIAGLKEITPRKYVTKSGVKNSATHVVPEKSLIVVTRVGLGKVGLTNVPMCFSQDSQALIGNRSLIYPEYSLYYLSKVVQIFKYQHRGTTISGVTKKQLSDLIFPLPPFNEQRRIANKIEELFSFLDAGVGALRKVQVQLKRYRQAVLKYAFEGKLTEEWRKTHKDHIEPVQRTGLEKGDETSLSRLPSEWSWAKVREIGELVSGQHILTENYNLTGEGLPYLTGPADFGYVNPIITKWTTKPKVVAENSDVLITVKGAGVGKVNVLNTEKAAISRQLMAIRSQHMNPYFLFYYLQSTFCQIQKLSSGSTVPGIRREELLDLAMPICSLSEQNKVVFEIENKIGTFENKEVLEQALKMSERLRQSILKVAFEGKLVPQDTSDEPATKLLERIKADRNNRKTESHLRNNRKKSTSSVQLELFRYVK